MLGANAAVRGVKFTLRAPARSPREFSRENGRSHVLHFWLRCWVTVIIAFVVLAICIECNRRPSVQMCDRGPIGQWDVWHMSNDVIGAKRSKNMLWVL